MNNQPKLDVSLIPNHVRMRLLAAIYDNVVEAYKDPEFEAAFQKWMQERDRDGKERENE